MNILITLLIYILVFGIAYYLALQIMASLGVVDPIAKIVKVILLLIALIVVLSLFFGGSYVDLPRVNIR